MHGRNAQHQERDISMRHFPADTSDEVSFQIPSFHDQPFGTQARGEGSRLGDVELDFDAFSDSGFLGSMDMDDPLATPVAKSIKHAPLTLSQLTPRREGHAPARPRDAVAVAAADSSMVREEGEGMAEESQKWQTETQTKQLSVRPPLLPKKESVDDMFKRRKRDNYQQMGIDLSSKSTARLRQHKDEDDMSCEQVHSSNNSVSAPVPTATGEPPEERPREHPKNDRNTAKTMPKRSILDKKNVVVAKYKPRVASSTVQPKSILKPSKSAAALPPSTLTRALATVSHTPQAERPRWGDVVAEVQHNSQRRESSGSGIAALGGGLIDVLVMYGEKLKGSLGFSSATNKVATPQASIPADNRLSSSNSSEKAHALSKPLTLSDLSPSKSEERQRNIALSDLTPDTNMESDGGQEHPETTISPMRPPQKRPSSGTSSEHNKKTRVKQGEEMRPVLEGLSKHSKTVREKGGANKVISRPRPLGPSRTLNKFPTTTHPRAKSQLSGTVKDRGLKSLGMTTLLAREGRSKAGGGRIAVTTDAPDDKEQQPPPSLTVPSAPVFAGDVHRQRTLEKTEKGRKQREQREMEKRNFKAGPMPYFNKPVGPHKQPFANTAGSISRLWYDKGPPARPAVRPTIPVAFTFHSDARAAQRNVEFEEKRKTWETRSTTQRQALPMPDFTALHAAQAQAAHSSRRAVVPVLPTDARALTTMVRAKEREKFEEERRERERAVERQREIRERERAELEEKEYREARKKTVPKAHEVPEWYKNLPWRKEGG